MSATMYSILAKALYWNVLSVECHQQTVCVFIGSDIITGSDRIGPDRARNWLFSSFLKHFFIIIMFVKYVYDHNNDVWIIKVGDDSYYLT